MGGGGGGSIFRRNRTIMKVKKIAFGNKEHTTD